MHRLGRFFARLSQRFLPDPLVLAVTLTLFVMAVACIAPRDSGLRAHGPLDRAAGVADLWVAGLASTGFLAFALQMCMILLTGFGLAKAPAATRTLDRLAGLARTQRGAVSMVALVSCLACWINWGFGLIVSGLLAGRVRERLVQKGIPCQFALIVASAYAGMMIWHGGLSGSAPLKVTGGVTIERPGEADTVRIHIDGVTIDRTILSPANLALTGLLFLSVPLAVRSMAGRPAADESPAPVVAERSAPSSPARIDRCAGTKRTPAEALNHAGWLRSLIVVVASSALVIRVSERGWGAVDLTFVILLFLTLGLMLHRDVASYMASVAGGGRAVTGIVIQFPLYAGIQSIMAGAGLAAAISHGFVEMSHWGTETLGLAPAATFPTSTFLSAGVVNLFVPSGGGQWIVQGPIMCSAADQLGLSIPQTVMAVAYGDQITNMIQPFWAIPLMGLTGVDARQFMGYCALLMLLAAPVFVITLLCF